MADTKMGNYSQSSSASANAPVVNTNNPEGGFLSSTMDFFNKNKTIIIGVIVLIIIGFIAYKYFGTERFTGASKKSIKGKNKAIKQMSEEESESEHFSDYQDEEQEQYAQDQDVQEQYTQEEQEQEQEQEQEEITEDFGEYEDNAEEDDNNNELNENFNQDEEEADE
jgi:Sec-independent protein translocase protein TatA